MPSPPRVRSIEESAWVNISNAVASVSGDKPMPVSMTRTTASPPSMSATTVIRPPRPVNFTALFNRLPMLWVSRAESTST